ncbi:MAG: hypothetical protein C4521_07615 [Actinobacteria bacterium]|nr:MAG: hypothetical protein C4521_07615 [Actinomycetota bacterium]
MMKPVLMECGCVATARNLRTGEPVCPVHYAIHPGATIVAKTQPDLEGRRARCAYYRSCKQEAPSSLGLAFFMYCPDKPFDEYYCGCLGWD